MGLPEGPRSPVKWAGVGDLGGTASVAATELVRTKQLEMVRAFLLSALGPTSPPAHPVWLLLCRLPLVSGRVESIVLRAPVLPLPDRPQLALPRASLSLAVTDH